VTRTNLLLVCGAALQILVQFGRIFVLLSVVSWSSVAGFVSLVFPRDALAVFVDCW
jgi:membrane glycosyltransferase